MAETSDAVTQADSDLASMVAGPVPPPTDDRLGWWKHFAGLGARAPIDRAIAGGFAAGRLAWAFASGYQAALAALLGDARGHRPAALCVTEAAGVSPRAIETRLEPSEEAWRVSGEKTFVTGARTAEQLFVLASEGIGADGRKRLRLVQVDAVAAGVELESLPSLPFVPEIGHSRLRLRGARVESTALLPGDGWIDYVRPFRTVEDIHVMAAVLGWTLRMGRLNGWQPEALERTLALLLTFRQLAALDPAAAPTHVALGGALAQMDSLVAAWDVEWSRSPETDRDRWVRDRALLSVARKAREQRLVAARRQCEMAACSPQATVES